MTVVADAGAVRDEPETATVRPRPGEYAVLVAVLGLVLGALPAAAAFFWSPKATVALVMIGPGLCALVLGAIDRDRAAWAGLAFLGIAGLATLLSPSPSLALTGLYNEGTGFLFLLAVVGAWALGRRLGAAAQRLLAFVLLGAAVVNAVMVWLQMSSNFTGVLFGRLDGRALGLLGNPVHATAFLVGATALAIELLPGRGTDGMPRAVAPSGDRARTERLLLIVLVGVFASAVQLTGGRIGIVLLAGVALRALVRAGFRRGALVVVAFAIGICAAVVVFPSGGAAGRLAESSSSSTFGGRIDRWRTAVPAVGDRPVLGIGPGLYRRATSVHDTAAAARAFGADALYTDAHDLLVQTVVTTGVLGLLALGLWLVLAVLGVHGPLAWFTLFAGVSVLFQPSFVGLTPVLALTLGAAAARAPRRFGRAATVVAVGLAVVGAVVGGLLLRGDVVLARAARDLDPVAARRAVQLIPLWPEPALVRSRVERAAAHRTGDAAHWPRAIAAAVDATTRDPSDPSSWATLGDLEAGHGSRGAAERAYATAVRWNPYSLAGLGGLATLAHDAGDDARVRALCRTVHEVSRRVTCPGPISR